MASLGSVRRRLVEGRNYRSCSVHASYCQPPHRPVLSCGVRCFVLVSYLQVTLVRPVALFLLIHIWLIFCCCLVAKLCLTLCDSLQHARLPCSPLYPGDCSDSCLLSWWCYLTISFSAAAFFVFNLSQHQDLLQWVSSLHQVAIVLELEHQPFPCIFTVDFL